MTTTKEELVSLIKEWVTLDNDIKTLQKEVKERKEKKKQLSDMLVEVMKDNEIDCFEMSEGKLIYSQNKVKSALSKKHIMNALSTFFDNDKQTAQEVSQYIMDSREVKIKETIRRKQQKK